MRRVAFRAWLRAFAQPFTYLGVGLLLFAAVALVYLADRENRNATDAALTKSEADARVFEEYISRVIRGADDTLLLLRKTYQRNPDNFDLAAWTDGLAAGKQIVAHFALLRADGTIAASTLGGRDGNIAASEHFHELARSSDDRLLIGKPFRLTSNGRWRIALSRRIAAPDGSFAGAIEAVIDPLELEPFYRSINLGSDGIASLVGFDGFIRARGTASGLSQAETFGKSIAGAEVYRRYRTQPAGSYWNAPGTVDPVPRLITYRALPDYPLIVIIGRSTQEVYQRASENMRAYYGIALFMTFGIVLSVTVCAMRQHKISSTAENLAATNLRFDTALEHIAHGMCMFDAKARITVCNRQYLEMYSLSPDVVRPGCTVQELMQHRKDVGLLVGEPEEHCRRILDFVRSGRDSSIRVEQADGRVISVLDRPIPGGGWITIHKDVTKEVKAEAELQETRNFLQTIVEQVPSSIIVKDARDFSYVLVNRAAEQFMNLPRDKVLGKTVHDIYTPAAAGQLQVLDEAIVRDGRQHLENLVPFHRAPDEVCHVTIDRVIVRGADGQPKFILGVVVDVTERRRSEAQIYHMAHHDALTGLANRVLFLKSVDEALARMRRFGDHFNILVLDLDQFKAVNDTLGHPVGDMLLKEAAMRLRTCTRETDIVARLGGDEFAILQQVNGDQGDQARVLSERLLEAIRQPFDIEGSKLVVGTSIGVALAPQDGNSADHLLKNADLALYRAKSEGRRRWRLFDTGMEAAARARHALENDLRNAIWRDEFEIHYQTLVAAATREPCGAEALVRWRHPQHGLLSPDKFIPLAEETGLIVPLGEWILRRACLDAVAWPAHIKLAVNLSAIQFNSPGLEQTVASILAQTGLSPARLELEITESVLLENDEANLALLHALRKLGVAVVLDDFGTGYSSLSYLQKFPFDKLKIDRSFVSELTSRSDSAAIVCAISSLAKSLSIMTTAEGIETEAQLQLLRATGIDQMQGYLFSRPRPKAELNFGGGKEANAEAAA
jgi:diguanylate cyclase (GGDEF)-like protein/PAS domain S-box-containing protein